MMVGINQPPERIMTAFQNEPSVDRRPTMTDELYAAELDAVIGGVSFFAILSNILKAQSETQKAIVANLR
jgi:hypothetical protein